jgi:hypothetical protein
MMHKYSVGSDIGSIAIKFGDTVRTFRNGYGDGEHSVYVDCDLPEWARFVEMFDVHDGDVVELLNYDCDPSHMATIPEWKGKPLYSPIHTFWAAAWSVWHDDESGDVYIVNEGPPAPREVTS